MAVRRPLLWILLALLTACGVVEGLPLPQDSREAVPPTPTAAPPEPSPTPPREEPEGAGRAFYRAWEAADYAGMYALLAPHSQALVSEADFVGRYQEAMLDASVQKVHAQPLAARQEVDTAEMTVRVTWETAVVGQVTADHTVPLLFDGGRWGVVWDESLIHPDLAGGNHFSLEYRIPSRANIYDIAGRALAFQGRVIGLGIIPGEIADEESLLAALSTVLDQTPEQIEARYANALPDWYVPLGDVTEETMQENASLLEPFIGAGLAPPRPRPARLYSEAGVAPHIVGYMGFIPAAEVDAYRALGFRGDEMVGRAGVEMWGEPYLHGEWGGVLAVLGPSGEYIKTLQEREAQQARNVYTSIDRDFQAAVEEALAEAIESHPLGTAGAVVMLDVHTGAVRAMASYPTYRPDIFDAARPDADIVLGQVLNDPGQPLLNRATQGAYPAGSTFKIVTLTAALNSGLYEPTTRYNSTGSWTRLGEENIKYDWREGGHGNITLRTALVVSCNSCFYDVGYTLDGVDPLLLPNTARQFGLDQPTGIQGVSEAAGLIPDPTWKLNNVGDGWATGDAVNMAIGQGFVLVTPLQLANILAAIANDGTMLRPTLIDRLGLGLGGPEEPWPVEEVGHLPLTGENMTVMRESLWNVANSPLGTATHRFDDLAVKVAGKTGTAEAPPGEAHAWFAGYAPAAPYTTADGEVIEEPEIAMAVIMEHTGEGSDVAAPVFRRILELYYGLEPLTPFPWSSE